MQYGIIPSRSNPKHNSQTIRGSQLFDKSKACDSAQFASVPRHTSGHGGLGPVGQSIASSASVCDAQVLPAHHDLGSGGSVDTANNLEERNVKWLTFPMDIGVPIALPAPQVTLVTDASNISWGAYCITHEVRGKWLIQEAQFHINF